MKDDKLDRILAEAFEEDPPDNGFTHRVVSMIAGRKRGWSRFLTRPALIAAAAVFISSAALATVAVKEPIAGSIRREVSKVIGGDESPRPTPSEKKTPRERPQSPGEADPERSPEGAPRPARSEKGYASSHTAYTSDGVLRLETETYANEAQAGSTQKVTISLRNVSSDPVTIYSPQGCMFAASATLSGEQRDENADRSDYERMACGGSGEDPRAQSDSDQQPVEIAPGETISADASIEFPQQGEWTVLGHCFCRRESSSPSASPRPSPRPSPSPTRSPGQVPLGELSLPLSSPSPSQSPSERPPPESGHSVTTPPIRIVAV